VQVEDVPDRTTGFSVIQVASTLVAAESEWVVFQNAARLGFGDDASVLPLEKFLARLLRQWLANVLCVLFVRRVVVFRCPVRQKRRLVFGSDFERKIHRKN